MRKLLNIIAFLLSKLDATRPQYEKKIRGRKKPYRRVRLGRGRR